MSYPIKYPTPQGANIQIFNAGEVVGTQTWIKPQGASFVWFTLIGGGGAGDFTTSGGGSGAVTNCMVPAFLIPDSLQIEVGYGGGSGGESGTSSVIKYVSSGTYTLLFATAGNATANGNGGAASTSNYFSCMGLFQSVAGQAGSSTSVSASPTTFLSGGGSNVVTANYGYQTSNSAGGNGFFQTQPIIVGVGGSASTADKPGGIGCGGSLGNANGGAGGDGLVVIITW